MHKNNRFYEMIEPISREAELGVPHSKSKLTGLDQNVREVRIG